MKNIRLIVVVILIFSAVNFPVNAQTHPNSIYLEFLGNTGLYSINYDRLFSEDVGIRIGFMYFESDYAIFFKDIELIFIPITLNYLAGSGDHKFELGGGPALVFGHFKLTFFGLGESDLIDANGIVGTATIGYRYQPVDGGFLFRIGFTPWFGFGEFYPSAGISLGISF
jgi:hypothetical protein